LGYIWIKQVTFPLTETTVTRWSFVCFVCHRCQKALLRLARSTIQPWKPWRPNWRHAPRTPSNSLLNATNSTRILAKYKSCRGKCKWIPYMQCPAI
jgi:hypothetical protein